MREDDRHGENGVGNSKILPSGGHLLIKSKCPVRTGCNNRGRQQRSKSRTVLLAEIDIVQTNKVFPPTGAVAAFLLSFLLEWPNQPSPRSPLALSVR